MSNISKMRLNLAAVVLLALGTVPLYFSYHGFCWSDGEFLTNRKLLQAAVGEVISFSNSMHAGSSETQPMEYRDPEDFRNENPECCQVHAFQGEGPPFPLHLSDVMLGRAHDWVMVTWRRKGAFPDGKREDVVRTNYVYVNNCGGVVNM